MTKEYKDPFPSAGVTLKQVAINVSGAHYRDLEAEAPAMLLEGVSARLWTSQPLADARGSETEPRP